MTETQTDNVYTHSFTKRDKMQNFIFNVRQDDNILQILSLEIYMYQRC